MQYVLDAQLDYGISSLPNGILWNLLD